ncbi:MAG: CoA pyrophosphatase [Pseudomonadota bacterium]|nr:CoA pyrophosphatase [Pseudomonadota bacterium]
MALTFNPQELPVLGIDDHLPAVRLAHLAPTSLRQRFASPPQWTPELIAENRYSDRERAHASVLVPLVLRDELTVLLTQRTDHLTNHPGQVSFPGGRAEAGDADTAATALREAREEIGLEAGQVEVLGAMPTYTTGSGFIITPVVGLVQSDVELRIDPFEVAAVFEVPLAFLMNPANHRHHAFDVGSSRREFLSMPWQGNDEQGRPQRFFIWGATAGMLRNLYRLLAA